MTDHKAEAEAIDIPTLADQAADGNGRGIIAALDAVRHSTLYLAEQQRIANLIALAHTDQDETARAALWEEVGEAFSAHYVLRDSIAEGLGLS